jgi:hypothetical protein
MFHGLPGSQPKNQINFSNDNDLQPVQRTELTVVNEMFHGFRRQQMLWGRRLRNRLSKADSVE